MTCKSCGFTSDTPEERCPRCGEQQTAAVSSSAPVEPEGASSFTVPPSTESFYANPIPDVVPVNPYSNPNPTPIQTAVPNDSGTGPQAVLPPELSGFNTGALFLNFIWAMSHSVWIGLLTLIPIFGLIMPIVLGFKGNEWAWQKRKWQSIEHFKATQKAWQQWGIGVFVASIGCGWFPLVILAAIMFPVFARARENARRASCQSHLQQISMAMMIYQQDYDDRFPPARIGGAGIDAAGNGIPYGWADSLLPYAKTTAIFQCPSDKTPAGKSPSQGGYTDYLFNSKLGGTSARGITNPATTRTLADGYGSNPGSDAAYSEAFDADGAPNGNPLHFEGLNYAFADGHIKWFRYNGPSASPPALR